MKTRMKVMLSALLAILVVTSSLVAVLSLTGQSSSPIASPPSGGAMPSTISVSSSTDKACAAITTCTTSGIAVVAYSTLVVVVSASSSVAPNGETSSPVHTLTSRGSSTVASTVGVWVYSADNISVSASQTVTITFAGSTTYIVTAIDVANTATSALDVAGSATSGNSVQAAASLTTTGSLDYAILATAELGNPTVSNDGTDSVVQSTASTTVVTGAALGETITPPTTATMAAGLSTAESWVAIAFGFLAASPPAAPTGLGATSVTQTTLALAWTKAAGPVVYFAVYQATYASSACGAYTAISTTVASATYSPTVTGSYNAAYCFYVEQSNAVGWSTASSSITVQMVHIAPPPTGLSAAPDPGSTTAVQLSWTNPSGSTLTDNHVYEGTSCLSLPTSKDLSGTQTSYLYTGLTAGTAYCFATTASNSTGESAESNTAAATTYAYAGAPTNLGVAGTTTTAVTLEWTNPTTTTGSLTNDTVVYGTTCGVWLFSVSTGGVTSQYQVTGLNTNVKYCFGVSTWNAVGQGSISATISAWTVASSPASPSGLYATGETATTVALAWTNPSTASGTITNITMLYGTTCGGSTDGSWTSTLSAGGGYTAGTVTGLSSGTSYCFAVTAWTQGGQSAASTTLTVSTLNAVPSAPTALAEVTSSRTTITISWTQPGGTLVNDTVYYAVYSGGSCGAYTGISAGGPSTVYQVIGLTAFTAYCFVVTAWTNGGQGAASSALSDIVSQSATPPAPTEVNVDTVGSTWFTIIWSNPALYTLYNDSVYYASSGSCGTGYVGNAGGWTGEYSLSAVGEFANVTGLSSNTSYCVEVVAWDGPSPFSASVYATTHIAVSPPPIVAAPTSMTTIVVVGAIGVVLLLALFVGMGRKKQPHHGRHR